eukprot:365214-Chlamydomonas_euryale.AAC.11
MGGERHHERPIGFPRGGGSRKELHEEAASNSISMRRRKTGDCAVRKALGACSACHVSSRSHTVLKCQGCGHGPASNVSSAALTHLQTPAPPAVSR